MAEADDRGISTQAKPGEFGRVLARLAEDDAYREKATKNPKLITKDFKLTYRELESLRDAAVLSGQDVSEVNKVRAAEIKKMADTGQAQVLLNDINISCCCCSCCCCGETAVAQVDY